MPQDITLIGHSVGGMIARTAVLLSNHPKCKVNTIILLSSPNMNPPYPLDMTLQRLYSKVNHAWMNSYYNDSKACLDAYRMHTQWLYNPSSPIVTTSHSINIGGNYECSVCISKIKVISFTGGSIDELVNEHNTALDFGPTPINRTIIQSPTSKASTSDTIFAPVHGLIFFIRYFATKINYLFHPAPPSIQTNATSSANLTSNDIQINSTSIHPWEEISSIHWNQHMRDFIPPQHIHVHTIQLKLVGFVVDHVAMMWCYQVLESITRMMEKLIYSGDSLYLSHSLPIKNQYKLGISNSTLPQVQYLLQRNHTTSMHHLLLSAEYQYIRSKAQSTLITIAVLFITTHWYQCFNTFMSISCLMMALYFFKGISNSSEKSYLSPWISISPSHHSFCGSLYSPFSHYICKFMGYKSYNDAVHFIASLFAIIVVGFSFQMWFEAYNSSAFIQKYSPFIFSTLAYSAALLLRLFLLSSVSIFRTSFSFIFSIVRITLRYTIYTKPIRKALRGPLKVIWKKLSFIFAIIEDNSLILAFGVVLLNFRLFQRNTSQLTTSAYAISVYLVSVYCLNIIAYLKVLLYPTEAVSSRYNFETDQVLFYWPIFITTLPPLYGAIDQCLNLSDSNIAIHSALQGLSSYDFECSFILTFVWLHLVSNR